MADSEGDYTVSPGKPPLHTRFKSGGCSALSPWPGSALIFPHKSASDNEL